MIIQPLNWAYTYLYVKLCVKVVPGFPVDERNISLYDFYDTNILISVCAYIMLIWISIQYLRLIMSH